MISSMNDLYPLIKEGVESGKAVKMHVCGNSMRPFIFNGESVSLKKDTVYKKNDIILYRRNDGHFVLHRIYAVKKDSFVLLGDNQFVKEYGIKNEQVIAKVVDYDRNGKTKYLKGFKYRLYIFVWRRILLRRVILKIMRLKENKKQK